MITLPNMRVAGGAAVDEDDQEREVIDIIQEHGKITVEALSEALKLGTTRCYIILKKLHANGKLKTVKNGRKIECVLNE